MITVLYFWSSLFTALSTRTLLVTRSNGCPSWITFSRSRTGMCSGSTCGFLLRRHNSALLMAILCQFPDLFVVVDNFKYNPKDRILVPLHQQPVLRGMTFNDCPDYLSFVFHQTRTFFAVIISLQLAESWLSFQISR